MKLFCNWDTNTLIVQSCVGESGLLGGGAPQALMLRIKDGDKEYVFRCSVTCTDAEVWPLRKAIQTALETGFIAAVAGRNGEAS